jgi:hypothetical protein
MSLVARVGMRVDFGLFWFGGDFRADEDEEVKKKVVRVSVGLGRRLNMKMERA